MTNETDATRSRPARRTIVKGAAWAVPAVAVASAAPAMAHSHEPINPSFQEGTFCKHSNGDWAHGVVCFDNTTGNPITLTLGDFVWDGAGTKQAYFSIAGELETEAQVPANTELCLFVDAGPYPSLGNAPARIYFTYPGAVGTPFVETEAPNSMKNCNATDQPSAQPPHPNSGP